jgi:hypothetical protein
MPQRDPIVPVKAPKPINPLPPGVEIRGGPYMPQRDPIPVSYPKPIGKDDPYVKRLIDNPPKSPVRVQDMRDDQKLGLYDAYKDLNTVQGWNTAYKTHGVGIKEFSPYYSAAHKGKTIHDANGNFMLNQNLGTEVTKGYTKYKLASQDKVDDKTVYTYIKSGNV